MEDYLDNKNYDDKSSIDEMYEKSNFESDPKMDFQSNYDTSNYEKSTDKEIQDKHQEEKEHEIQKEIEQENDKCLRNKNLNYEEWVYKNENKMNDDNELFDGVFAYVITW